MPDFDRLPLSTFEKLPRLVQDFLGQDGYGAGRCDPHFLDQVSQPAASAVCLALDDRMIGLPGAS